ncbi:MAG: glycosyltransferase family 4 protein [Bifidobacteriaceae bacterium]|jgi:glycosyltransferase involved in cell wall biosynthesis|nr:glycosyltransferase family 4 protein [Bifidobacteriaceae bacterium]
MPGNNALVDARVMKNLRTAAELGYEAIALGVARGEAVREETFDWGGRVIIQPVPVRYEAWRRYRRWRLWFDRTERSNARAYAAHLRQVGQFEADRALREAGRAASVKAPGHPAAPVRAWRRLRCLAVRLAVKAMSLPADREIKRDTWDPVKLEAWRRRRFAWLKVTPWRAHWRKALPGAVDQAMAVAGQLDRLAPDIVHVHDVYLMHAAAWYAGRAARAGRPVRLVYDARELVPGLAHVPPRRVAAYSALEREFIQDFDRVITVSDPLADRLTAAHGLVRRPDLVLNAPMRDDSTPQVPSVRAVAGVPAAAPLAVYAGGVNPARGLGSVVRALAELEGVHLAVVVNNLGTAVSHLQAEAQRLGLADRLHLVPFVPHDQVTRYLESADLGLSPLSRAPNHDVALTNKFCEYIEAGLPVVTSDTPEQARLVRELDLGEVFTADDPADLARAVRRALDRLDALKSRLRGDQDLRWRFSWAAQAEVLARVYAEEAAALGLAAAGRR